MPHPKHPEIRCETCVFFDASGRLYGDVCRRTPPVDYPETGAVADFPGVLPDDWCGEHPAMAAVLLHARIEAISRIDAQDAPKEVTP